MKARHKKSTLLYIVTYLNKAFYKYSASIFLFQQVNTFSTPHTIGTLTHTQESVRFGSRHVRVFVVVLGWGMGFQTLGGGGGGQITIIFGWELVHIGKAHAQTAKIWSIQWKLDIMRSDITKYSGTSL